jgi:phosphoribosyl 1,2-cyclic phosphate phosphodiesterase
VDAILYTHYHADHLFGLDDARLFPKHLGRAVPVYCEADVERVVRRAFDYAFGGPVVAGNWVGIPQIEFKTIRPAERFEVLGESILPIRFKHGKFQVVGFRVDNLAYCTDVSAVPDESWEHLEGLDVLILDALRYEPHPTHLSLDQALAIIDRLKPRRTFLTHLSHTFDHAPTESTLPEGVALAYDGLAIDF